ncbi:hypothetical protein F5Y00DRAFT_214695 [Daldinia vernicosa]|uniref:uncharacterized protein n=1 Tax=Daldinia vernicosa TaxID=114800 RepID=UPI0020072BBC|nr:uncharacterized protein F5Y00DRAFT_214695 [Daldinia vernicosa]KAI0851659.1 hypothetical protein F5Y00DRAFT_214695 [Daldinia vernicosa]
MVSATSPSPFHSPTHSSYPQTTSSPLPPSRKKTMSVTQTYFLAHKARAKLSNEAARPDHNLRLLVGHANLLDSLMLDLAEAEREQESWFNQSVRGATPKAEERHVQWADNVAAEDDWEADSSDSDSDSDEEDEDEDVEMADALPLVRIASHTVLPPASPQLHLVFEDENYEDDDEDYGALSLTRSPSHLITSPPELEHDSDSSEDEAMPPSPPAASIPTFSEKQRESTVTTEYLDSRQEDEEDNKSDFYSEGYYLPPRNTARIVSTISVY